MKLLRIPVIPAFPFLYLGIKRRVNRVYPFIFEINNGWGKPVITRNNGVITEEGSVHYEDSVKVYMKEEHLFPMLQRVNLFIQAMTVQGMEKYFDRVSSPILNSEAE